MALRSEERRYRQWRTDTKIRSETEIRTELNSDSMTSTSENGSILCVFESLH
jgi:hypothetical protein